MPPPFQYSNACLFSVIPRLLAFLLRGLGVGVLRFVFVEFESSWDPMSYHNDPYDQILHAWHLFFSTVSFLRLFVRIDMMSAF
jgi:hypothetical protein